MAVAGQHRRPSARCSATLYLRAVLIESCPSQWSPALTNRRGELLHRDELVLQAAATTLLLATLQT